MKTYVVSTVASLTLILSGCEVVPYNPKAFEFCEKVITALQTEQSIEVYDAMTVSVGYSDSEGFQTCRISASWSGYIKQRGYIDGVISP